MHHTTRKLIFIVTGFLLDACDPVYSIRAHNLTNDTITVVARTTVHFHSNNIDYMVLSGPYNDQRIKFTVLPGKYVDCGRAIGELEDDLPFRELYVYTKEDSTVANTSEEVLSLFKTNSFGRPTTPYDIEIK